MEKTTMTKRIIILLLLIAISLVSCFKKKSLLVFSGQVLFENTNSGVPFAKVYIMDRESPALCIFDSTVSGVNGEFSLATKLSYDINSSSFSVVAEKDGILSTNNSSIKQKLAFDQEVIKDITISMPYRKMLKLEVVNVSTELQGVRFLSYTPDNFDNSLAFANCGSYPKYFYGQVANKNQDTIFYVPIPNPNISLVCQYQLLDGSFRYEETIKINPEYIGNGDSLYYKFEY